MPSTQWLVMRGKVRQAGIWIPANMLAWTFGMPVIFWGIDMAFKMSAIWQSVLLMADFLSQVQSSAASMVCSS